MNKPIIYIDMDGVLVDLQSEIDTWFMNHPNVQSMYKGHADRIPGIFRNPPPIEGAIEAVKKLHNSDKYELFIATTAPWGNPESLTDKRYWIETHFGNIFYKRIFTTHRKDLLVGDILIDDRTANGAGNFPGTHILFGSEQTPDWNSVLKLLLE